MTQDKTIKLVRRIYLAAMAVMVLTGFGNMPIYKRYYINEIPGMGWTADFYANIQIHYLAGAAVLATAVFLALNHLLTERRSFRLTKTGLARLLILAAVLATGLMMLAKNLPSVSFSPGLATAMTLSHLATVMVFLFFSLGCLIARTRWLKPVRN